MGENKSLYAEKAVEETLAAGLKLQRLGRIAEARKLYEGILKDFPNHAEAVHSLGTLEHQCGDLAAAERLIRRAIALGPSKPDRYVSLGNVLLQRGRFEEAVDAYGKAIALAPDHADTYNNLAAALWAQKRYDEAAAAYQKALLIDPHHVEALNNVGNLFWAAGKRGEAAACYHQALKLMPSNPEIGKPLGKARRELLGAAYSSRGEIGAAVDVYREWLREEPDNPVARHMLAACTGENTPQRAADDYIETTFDAAAGIFDAQLEALAYRGPQLVAGALASAAGPPREQMAVLDAGCGTGLAGPLIKPYARRLTGVDLSSEMLARARSKNVYDELVQAEMVGYMGSQHGAYDLIAAVDCLNYLGPLDAALRAAAGALNDGGLLIFTVEKHTDEETSGGSYRLHPHGRYSHGDAYLRKQLEQSRLSLIGIDAAVLRTEMREPVDCLVVSCRKEGP